MKTGRPKIFDERRDFTTSLEKHHRDHIEEVRHDMVLRGEKRVSRNAALRRIIDEHERLIWKSREANS